MKRGEALAATGTQAMRTKISQMTMWRIVRAPSLSSSLLVSDTNFRRMVRGEKAIFRIFEMRFFTLLLLKVKDQGDFITSHMID
jgi:hypothetical protein